MKLLFTCHGQSESLKVILFRLKPREPQEQGHARQPPSPGDTAWKHSRLQWLRSDTTRGLPCRDAASSWEEGTEDAAATGECSGCALWSACPCRAFWPWGTGSLHRGWEHSRSARPGSSPGSPTPPGSAGSSTHQMGQQRPPWSAALRIQLRWHRKHLQSVRYLKSECKNVYRK